jgi:hypothetical protein
MRLTKLTVERTRRPGRYGDGEGLWLQVTATSKSWLLRYQLRGRARYMGLGPVDVVSLAEARELARAARRPSIRSSTADASVPSRHWPA